MESADIKLYVGLKAFIWKDSSLLLLQGSSKMEREGLWGLPGGKIQERERNTPLPDVLLREVREECGSNLLISIKEPCSAWKFPGKDILLVGFRCEYKNGEIVLSSEHKDYTWLSQSDSIDDMEFAPGYKEVIQEALRK